MLVTNETYVVAGAMRLTPLLVAGLGFLTLAICPAMRAQGAPPFFTNDPGTPGPKSWEINLLGAFERRADDRASAAPAFDIKYGIGDRCEIGYQIAHLNTRSRGAPRLTGWSNSLVGAKWRFLDEGEKGYLASIYPQVEFNNPHSATVRRSGLVDSDTTVTLPIQAQRSLGDITVFAEVGHIIHLHRSDEWFGGIAVGRSIGKKVAVGFEVHGHGSEHLARSHLLANLCANLAVNEHNGILIALGRELHNHFETKAGFVGLIGWQFLR